MPDTIAALASGWASSPRAMVRLAGPATRPLLANLLTPPLGRPGLAAARFHLTPTLALPLLVARYDAPGSFTGEDAAELLLPGNPALVERVLAVITAWRGPDGERAREATPGEFSSRAYVAGRLSIEQAEGVAATIAAGTDAELDAARRLLRGESGARYAAWAEELATLMALVEAGIDFTDQEDVVPITPSALAGRLRGLATSIGQSLGSSAGSAHRAGLPVVALAGAPNAGKSTLFNALLGRRRAVESPIAGTTRDTLREPLDLSAAVPGGLTVLLVDLAGIGDGANVGQGSGIEAAAQARAAEVVSLADVVVHCDPTGRFGPLPPDDGRAPTGVGRVVRVRTKADLVETPVAQPPHEGEADIAVCALDGWNLGPLRRAIADAAWGGAGRGEGEWLLPRHRRALASATAAALDALALIEPDAARGRLGSPELVAGSLREALDAVGELTGRLTPDDVVGRVFATFCVGK